MTKIVKHPEAQAIEIFHEFLDNVNFKGYAAKIAENMPELYEYEKMQFFNNYTFPPAKVIKLSNNQ